MTNKSHGPVRCGEDPGLHTCTLLQVVGALLQTETRPPRDLEPRDLDSRKRLQEIYEIPWVDLLGTLCGDLARLIR